MSEHIGPGIDSGPFKRDEADRRAAVDELERKRLDAMYAENAENAAENKATPKKSKKKK